MPVKLEITRPSIIIGLGGTGKKVGLQLKAKLLAKSANDTLPDGVKFLFFDTDDETPKISYLASDGTSKDVLMANSESVRGWNFQATEWLRQKKQEDAENGTDYFSSFYDDLKPGYIKNGAGQIRQIGRLCFFFALNRFVQSLEKQIDVINGITGTVRTAIDSGEPVNALPNTNIFIISSAGGGTGAGCFLDVAYVARHLAPPDTNIQLVLFLAETLPRYNELGIRYQHEKNSYAALQELEYFNIQKHFDFTYPTRPAPMRVTNDEFPTDLTMLVSNYTHHGKNIGDFDQIVKMTADMMNYYMTSSINVDSYVDNIKRLDSFILPLNGRSCHYMTFGITRIALPKKEMITLAECSGFNKLQAYLNTLSEDFDASEIADDYLTNNRLNEFETDDLIDSICPADSLTLGVPDTFMSGKDLTLENDQLVSQVNRIQGDLQQALTKVKNNAKKMKKTLLKTHLDQLISDCRSNDGAREYSFSERMNWCLKIAKNLEYYANLMESEILSPGTTPAGFKAELSKARNDSETARKRLNRLRLDYIDGERNFIKKFLSKIFPGMFSSIDPGESEVVITELIRNRLLQCNYELEILRRTLAKDILLDLRKHVVKVAARLKENQTNMEMTEGDIEVSKNTAWAMLKRKNIYLDMSPISNDKIRPIINKLCRLNPKEIVDQALAQVDIFGADDIDLTALRDKFTELIADKAQKAISKLTLDDLFKTVTDDKGDPILNAEEVLGLIQKTSTGLWPLHAISVEELRQYAPPYFNLIISKAENNALADKKDSLADAVQIEVLEHSIEDEAICMMYEHSAALYMLSTIKNYRSSFETYSNAYGLTSLYTMGPDVTRNLVEIENRGTERRVKDLETLAFGYAFDFVEIKGNWWYALTFDDLDHKIKNMAEALAKLAAGDEKREVKIRRERMLGQAVKDEFGKIVASFAMDHKRTVFVNEKVNDFITLRGEEAWGNLLYIKWLKLKKTPTIRKVLEEYCRKELGKEIHEFKVTPPEKHETAQEDTSAEGVQ